MSQFRSFTNSGEGFPIMRSIDSDAPSTLRHELIDCIFHFVEHDSTDHLQDSRIYQVICQSLGQRAAAQPHGGFRYAAGRNIDQVDWQRIYDLICRLWPEVERAGQSEKYREEVNQILSANGVVWDLDEEGNLRRTLPQAAQQQVKAALVELSAPRFHPALSLFSAAREAYDDRPRRDRDACSNVFDALESVAKEVYQLPNSTFGQVVHHLGQTKALNADVISVLKAVNDLRNHNFGHGMTKPFSLKPSEVDFTYLTCIAGILLLTR